MALKLSNGLDLVGARAENLADPAAATDAVNRRWVEARLAELAPEGTVRKRVLLIGDGAATELRVVHELGTEDLTAAFYDAVSGDVIGADYTPDGPDELVVRFVVAPAADGVRAVVIG